MFLDIREGCVVVRRLSFGVWPQLAVTLHLIQLVIVLNVILLSLLQFGGRKRLVRVSSLILNDAFLYQDTFEVLLEVPQRLICKVISIQEL